MKARIVELYLDGRRIPRDVALAADPISGELIVSGTQGNQGRYTRMADLVQITPGYKRQMMRPIFDPELIRMSEGDGGFVLRGWQILSEKVGDDHQVTEFVQEWWVRP